MRIVPNMPLLSSKTMLLAPALSGGGQLLPVHHEITITRDSESDAFADDSGRNPRRHAVTHRTIGGCELGFEAFGQAVVFEKTVQPAGKVACAIGQHGICGQVFLQGGDDGGHVDGAGEFQPTVGWVNIGQVIVIGILSPKPATAKLAAQTALPASVQPRSCWRGWPNQPDRHGPILPRWHGYAPVFALDLGACSSV